MANMFSHCCHRRYVAWCIVLLVVFVLGALSRRAQWRLPSYDPLPWRKALGEGQQSPQRNGNTAASTDDSAANPSTLKALAPDSLTMASVRVPYVPAADSPAARDKVVVTGKLQDEDTKWLQEKLPDWQHAVYTILSNDSDPVDAALDPQYVLASGKGRESFPYLTYIIQHYDNLPSLLAFVHPHDSGWPLAWHTEGHTHSNAAAIQRLNAALVKEMGYVNFRCTHDPGCPKPLHPFDQDPDGREPQPHLLAAWRELFPDIEPPRDVAATCCAQFAVSRDRVLERPKRDYERMRDWLLETGLPDDVSGRIFEYLWHIIFRRPAVDCPSQRDCFCKVYNAGCRRAVFGGG